MHTTKHVHQQRAGTTNFSQQKRSQQGNDHFAMIKFYGNLGNSKQDGRRVVGCCSMVRCNKITVKHANRWNPVLQDLTINIEAGQLVMLLGSNGCGKSTLLKTIGGLLQPTQGQVAIEGKCGYVFQNPDMQVLMPTVAADVAFSLASQQLSDDEVRQRVQKCLSQVGLSGFEEKQISVLSGGEKQRVAIAGVLAIGADILLLDELTTYLSEVDWPDVVQAVRAQVDQRERQVCAVWVTHRLEEVRYSDYVYYMDGGKISKHGTPNEILNYLEKQGAFIPPSNRAQLIPNDTVQQNK